MKQRKGIERIALRKKDKSTWQAQCTVHFTNQKQYVVAVKVYKGYKAEKNVKVNSKDAGWNLCVWFCCL